MTKEEKRHLAKVAALGCIVCRNEGFGRTAAEIHHVRNGQGMSQRASNFEVIPLCHAHHRTGGRGIAFHAGKQAFESKYGTERELLAQVNQLLNQDNSR